MHAIGNWNPAAGPRKPFTYIEARTQGLRLATRRGVDRQPLLWDKRH